MEKITLGAFPIPVVLYVAIILLMLPAMTMAQDTSGPQITDLTTGTPKTGDDFLITASVTDDSGVSLVRLYSLYFVVPNGITTPETITMSLVGTQYESNVNIPQNASKLSYTILASDTLSHSSISNVMTWDIQDNQDPKAVCAASIFLNMNTSYTFNGSGSSDNVEVSNYTWTISLNGTGITTLYGPFPIHRFPASGNYSGRLTVRDPWGNSGYMNFQVRANDTEPPKSDAGLEMYGLTGRPQMMDGSGSGDNAGIVNYSWSFMHNGTQVALYGISPSFTFWNPGTYQITLTVTDAAGLSDSSATTLEILGDGSETTESNWWIYVLVIMIIAIVILAIVIARMK